MEHSKPIMMLQNSAGEQDIFEHLARIDQCHLPTLSERVNLKFYAEKLKAKAHLIELWDEQKLIGLIAYYKTQNQSFYISNISVEAAYREIDSKPKLAQLLMDELIQLAQTKNILKIELTVFKKNLRAIQFYSKYGFESIKTILADETVSMSLDVNKLNKRKR